MQIGSATERQKSQLPLSSATQRVRFTMQTRTATRLIRDDTEEVNARGSDSSIDSGQANFTVERIKFNQDPRFRDSKTRVMVLDKPKKLFAQHFPPTEFILTLSSIKTRLFAQRWQQTLENAEQGKLYRIGSMPPALHHPEYEEKYENSIEWKIDFILSNYFRIVRFLCKCHSQSSSAPRKRKIHVIGRDPLSFQLTRLSAFAKPDPFIDTNSVKLSLFINITKATSKTPTMPHRRHKPLMCRKASSTQEFPSRRQTTRTDWGVKKKKLLCIVVMMFV